jgi:molybdopterin-guanine dinucleotide biosynthesis protein A
MAYHVNDWAHASVSGIILNGGASARFGCDKATFRIRGRTMLERALGRLAALFGEILVVGRPEACSPHPALTRAIPDAIDGAGPLGGIYTGLLAMSRPFGFFAACDMPCLDPRVIRRQLSLARTTQADAVVPAWDGYWEPLHAVYSQDCVPAARRQLESGDFRIRGFFEAVDVVFWDIRAEGIATRPFTNVNTKSDLAALLGDNASRL